MRTEDIKDAIGLAFGGVGYQKAFGSDNQDTGSIVAAHVCPFCHRANTSRALKLEPLPNPLPAGIRDDRPRFQCTSCGEKFKRPLMRRVQGSINLRTTVSRSSADWWIVDAVECGVVERAVNRLPELERAWVMCTYTEDYTGDQEKRLMDFVMDSLDIKGIGKPRSWRHAKNVMIVSAMMIEHTRQVERSGVQLYSKADLGRATDLYEDAFKPQAHWGRIYTAIDKALGDLNRKALDLIYAATDEIRAKKAG